MIELHCGLCGLFLGEAACEVEITCPLCLELVTYVEMTVRNTLPRQDQWDQDVSVKVRQNTAIIEALLQKRSLEIV